MIQPPKLIVTQPPKPTVASARQPITKRRETKNSITMHVSNAIPTTSSVPSSAAASAKPEFRKPNEIEPRTNKPKVANGLKCQYCDKCFVKNHGMTTHLLEKCEKIPAIVRRQLIVSHSKSKPLLRQEELRHESDLTIYSRFFVNISNEGASSLHGDEVVKGLKNLRAELRKIKSAHTGIIRTPNKTLRCHVCKKHFLDCVEYAEHITNCILKFKDK